jgi:hypothetical protein
MTIADRHPINNIQNLVRIIRESPRPYRIPDYDRTTPNCLQHQNHPLQHIQIYNLYFLLLAV